MSIIELSESEKNAWNEFVMSTPDGTFFHLAQWKKILEHVFGFQTFYLMHKENGSITSILPLALVKRPIFGSALISSPLCVNGGGLGNSYILEEYAIKKAQKLGVQYLELRNSPDNLDTYLPSNCFSIFNRALSNSHEENLTSIPRKQRAEIRKAMASNLKTTINQDIDSFYKIYTTSVRNLGTPVFTKKYLPELINSFGKACEIITIWHQEKPLSSVLSFKYKDRILPYYGGGVFAARQYSAYPYMYWKVMENAVEQGLNVFDFGRSMTGSGAYSFKKNFGFKPKPLTYHYHLVKAKNLPDMDVNNLRNKILTSTWKKLPLPIANMAGPLLYPIVV